MPVFEHTAKEPGMWRGWIKNGDSLEITWPKTSIGFRYALTDTDGRGSHKQLWIGLGFIQAFIPLGSSDQEFPAMEGPQWGFDLSREFGIVLHWNKRRKSWDWPLHVMNLAYEELTDDGRWVDVMAKYRDGDEETLWSEVHPYTYTLRSGEVQHRKATITQRRFLKSRHILHRLGWPVQDKRHIDVNFDGEVGEDTGSWKGGTVGCGYDMLPGETPLDTLRRMEREREFSR